MQFQVIITSFPEGEINNKLKGLTFVFQIILFPG